MGALGARTALARLRREQLEGRGGWVRRVRSCNGAGVAAQVGSLTGARIARVGIDRRVADRPGGRSCKGRKLDCQVDYLQFCHTAEILDKFRETYNTTQYHSEDRRDAHHADGIFMEQIGALTKVYNIDKVLSMNRRTVESANLEYSASPFGRLLVTLRAKLRGARERLSPRRRY